MSTEERVAKLEEWRCGHAEDYKELFQEVCEIRKDVTSLSYDLRNGLIGEKVSEVLEKRNDIGEVAIRRVTRRQDIVLGGLGAVILLSNVLGAIL